MRDEEKTKEQLINELVELRQRIAEFSASGAEWKQAEKELRESEEKYRSIFNNAQVGLFRTRLSDGKILECNERLAQMFAYRNREECIANFVASKHYLDSGTRERMLTEIKKVGNVNNFEARLSRENGSIIWVRYSATLHPERGHLEGVVTDITEEMHAADALRESKENLQTLFNTLDDLLFIFDSDERIIHFNPAVQERLGHSNEELFSMRFSELHPPERQEEAAAIVAETLLGNISVCLIPLLARNGTLIPAETKVTRGKWGGQDVLFAISRDITERRQAEEELKESYETLVTVLESIDADVYVADMEAYEILYMNKHMQGSFEGNLVGKICHEVLRGSSDPCTHCTNDRLLDSEGNPTGVFVWEGQNPITGTWYVNYDRAIRWIDGRFVRLQVATDISELKTTEEERDVLQSQLLQAQKMEAVGTLAGGVAHDFNNLLQAIQGYAELQLFDKDAGDPGYPELQEISRAAKRGEELTQHLLTFGRRIESKLSPTDLNQEVEKVKKLLNRTIPKMIEIELCLVEDLKVVNADSGQIEQVLMNLAVNARDAMPEGGKLAIQTDNVTLGEDFCKGNLGSRPGDYVLLRISDTGHGINGKTLGRIFEPFFSTKGPGKGTGLGLAMVHGIVKSHDGYITCASTPGEGTTFSIFLPVIEQMREVPQSDDQEVSVVGGSETILLVDDEQTVRNLGEKVLSRLGYTVFTAPHGESALELYRKKQEQIDLVILDLIMPGMGGWRCLEELLKIDRGVRVLIASGYAANAPMRESIDIGAKGFVSKPYKMNRMLRVVREVLDET